MQLAEFGLAQIHWYICWPRRALRLTSASNVEAGGTLGSSALNAGISEISPVPARGNVWHYQLMHRNMGIHTSDRHDTLIRTWPMKLHVKRLRRVPWAPYEGSRGRTISSLATMPVCGASRKTATLLLGNRALGIYRTRQSGSLPMQSENRSLASLIRQWSKTSISHSPILPMPCRRTLSSEPVLNPRSLASPCRSGRSLACPFPTVNFLTAQTSWRRLRIKRRRGR